MPNNNIFTGVLGALIVLGLIVLIVIEATAPTRVKTVTKTEIVPIPYHKRRYRSHYRRPYW